MTSLAGYRLSRGVSFGAIGGLIAGVIMAAIGYGIPIPMMHGEPFFINAIDMYHWSSVVFNGWMLHIFTCLVIGAVFGILTTRVGTLRASSLRRGLVFGALTGLVVWIFLFLPVTIPPMPDLVSMSDFLVESLGYHLVFGLVLGGSVAVLLAKTHQLHM